MKTLNFDKRTRQRVRFLLFGIVVSATLTYACGPDWTYLGRPTFEALSMTGVPGSSTLLAGVRAASWVPGSGGIYRWDGPDTTWEYVALENRSINDLVWSPSHARTVFAAASQGIYFSTDDGLSWELGSTVTPANYLPIYLAISPIDSNEWAISQFNFDTNWLLKVTFDAGANWQVLHFGSDVRSPIYSPTIPGLLFFGYGATLRRVVTSDSLFETMRVLDYEISSMVYHPIQPWLFALTERNLLRYDEEDDSFIEITFPDSIGLAHSMILTPAGMPLVGANSGVYLFSEDLTEWQALPGPIGPPYAARVFDASEERWVVGGVGGGIYCHGLETRVDPRHPIQSSYVISVLPNPANEQVSLIIPFRARVDIYNMLGQQVYSSIANEPNVPLIFQSKLVSSGIYYVLATQFSSAPLRQTSATIHIVK